MSFTILPHIPTTPAYGMLADLFYKTKVALPDTPVTYHAHTNDFGVQIEELLVVGQAPDYVDNCTRLREDIHQVAKRLGIRSKNIGPGYYPRDFFIKDCTGQIMGPMKVSQEKAQELDTATCRANSKEVCANAMKVSNRAIIARFGHCAKLADLVFQSVRSILAAPFYFEGGNTFTLTNSQNVIKVLHGKAHLYTALNLLRLNKVPIAQATVQLDEMKIRKTAEKMYSQGLLKQEGKTGLIDESKLSLEEIRDLFIRCKVTDCSIAEGFFQLGHARKFTWNPSQAAECKEMVAKYLCQKKLAKELIATSLKVKVEDVVFLPSCDAHLDLFIRPGPNCIFLADFALAEKVCLELLKLQLDANDKKHLEIYIQSAQKRQAELVALLAKTKEKLENAGFTVVPMPGVFTYDFPTPFSKSYNFNFMNAVTGYSPVTQKYYYIIGGVEVGNLGLLFMDALQAFIRQYEPNTECYFVGRDADPNKFSEIMKIMNSVGKSYGNVHCATFETVTLSHTK